MNIKRHFYYLISLAVMCSCGQADKHHHHHHHLDDEETEVHEHHEHEHEHDHDHDHEAKDAHEHADEIHLSPEQAEQFGVVVDTLRSGDFMSGLKVAGRIIAFPSQQAVVVAPSDGIVNIPQGVTPGMELRKGERVVSISARGVQGGDQVEAARIAYEGAQRELDRLTPLHEEGIVSTARYNEALQAVELAKAAMSNGNSHGSVAVSPISGTLTQLSVSQGEYVTTGQQLAAVASVETLVLQADVPVSKADILPSITSADFKVAGCDDVIRLSDLYGRRSAAPAAMAADPSALSGVRPVYFTFRNPGNLTPGTAVEATLLADSGHETLSVPKSALIEQEGYYFAFVRVHPDAYVKRMVTIGASNGSDYEIKSGLQAGDEVVMKGATIVKLAASSGRVPEGHSHNH